MNGLCTVSLIQNYFMWIIKNFDCFNYKVLTFISIYLKKKKKEEENNLSGTNYFYDSSFFDSLSV